MLLRIQSQRENQNRFTILKEVYQKGELCWARFFGVVLLIFCALFLVSVPTIYLVVGDKAALRCFRWEQFCSYSLMCCGTIVVSTVLMRRLRTKMFLYYVELKGKLYINIFGTLAFMGFQLVHIVQSYVNMRYKKKPTEFEHYCLYFLLELVSCAVMFFSKVTEDLFVMLNRERTLLKISIFQHDYLRGVDRTLLAQVKVSGDTKELRN